MAEAETEAKQFSKGVEVLARWRDGIWYLANVVEVDETGKRCQVVFEDGTVVWLFHKDLQSSLTQLDLQCMVCNDGTSKKPNEIVLCDQCEQGYHQKCHSPEITSDVLQTNAEWFCRQCVFGNSAKAGGATKQGPDAEALRSLKRSLPYNLDSLHWDSKHKNNKEDLYCYCGGPGDWSSKMLQCNRCQQWFHEACIQCLNHPLLSGDRFYIFVCGVCNKGKEYIKRLKLRWMEVAHFALYYLSTTYRKKFHSPDDILDYVDDHWDVFQLGESTRAARKEAHEAIKEVLRSTPSRFRQSPSEPFSYSLKNRTPPQPPKQTEPLPPPGTVAEDEAAATGVQQGKRGRKRRHDSPGLSSSTDDHSEAKSRKTSKARELHYRLSDQRAAEKKALGRPKGSKSQTREVNSQQGEDESVPMFPSASMFKYLYSSSSRSPEDSTTQPTTSKDAASSATSTTTLSTDAVTQSVSEQRSTAEPAVPASLPSSAQQQQQPLKINFVPDPVSKGTSKDKTPERSPAVELPEETAALGGADSGEPTLKTSAEDTRHTKAAETIPPTEQSPDNQEKKESCEPGKQETGEISGKGRDTITSEKEESRDGERDVIAGAEAGAGCMTEVEKVPTTEVSHAVQEVDVMQGSHIVSHVLELEDPVDMETEGRVIGHMIGESINEEQTVQQEVSLERLVTEDVEDYVMISHVAEGHDRVEADESTHVTDQSSGRGNAESSDTTGGDNLDKTEPENQLEEENTGANSEFVLVMEESLEDEGDSLQNIREEDVKSVSTNGHVAEEGTPLGFDTNGVTTEKKNEIDMTDEPTAYVTEETPSTDLEKNEPASEDSGVQIICHATEEKYHIVVESKTRGEQLVEPSVLGVSHATQLTHSQVEEEKGCVTQLEASAAIDTLESKDFITDTDYEMIPVQHCHTEEK